MNAVFKKNLYTASVVSVVCLVGLISGCASMAVSNEAIENNTAFALGIDKGTFTISDRVDDGVKTSYSVKTNSGKRYNCYVTGSVTPIGRTVSDAICNRNKSAKQSKETGEPCNALLKAAGKCN